MIGRSLGPWSLVMYIYVFDPFLEKTMGSSII